MIYWRILKHAAIATTRVGMPIPNPTPRDIRSDMLNPAPPCAVPVLVGSKVIVEWMVVVVLEDGKTVERGGTVMPGRNNESVGLQ